MRCCASRDFFGSSATLGAIARAPPRSPSSPLPRAAPRSVRILLPEPRAYPRVIFLPSRDPRGPGPRPPRRRGVLHPVDVREDHPRRRRSPPSVDVKLELVLLRPAKVTVHPRARGDVRARGPRANRARRPTSARNDDPGGDLIIPGATPPRGGDLGPAVASASHGNGTLNLSRGLFFSANAAAFLVIRTAGGVFCRAAHPDPDPDPPRRGPRPRPGPRAPTGWSRGTPEGDAPPISPRASPPPPPPRAFVPSASA